MDNASIKGVLDGLTKRGVLSADGRRQVFNILLQQAREHEQETSLLKNDLEHARTQRDAFKTKLDKAVALLPKTKLKELD